MRQMIRISYADQKFLNKSVKATNQVDEQKS